MHWHVTPRYADDPLPSGSGIARGPPRRAKETPGRLDAFVAAAKMTARRDAHS